MKKAFTIIEMMAVMAIIAILLGIVMSATANSIRLARSQKADAIVNCVQQGIDTYHAQKDEWPGSFGRSVSNGGTVSGNDFNDQERYELNASQVKDTILDVVKETVQGNPLFDISGLYVSRDSGENNSRSYGMDFWEAVRGTKKHPKKMSVSEMNFGYPESDTGRFRRLKIVYSITTDSMEVKK